MHIWCMQRAESSCSLWSWGLPGQLHRHRDTHGSVGGLAAVLASSLIAGSPRCSIKLICEPRKSGLKLFFLLLFSVSTAIPLTPATLVLHCVAVVGREPHATALQANMGFSLSCIGLLENTEK